MKTRLTMTTLWLTAAMLAGLVEPAQADNLEPSFDSNVQIQAGVDRHTPTNPEHWARLTPPKIELVSSVTRSGVWDGALLFDRSSDFGARVWWRNLTGRDFDSVQFRPSPAGVLSSLDSEPASFGITLTKRLGR